MKSISTSIARRRRHGFFGLPEVKPLQEALMPEVEERMRAALKAMDAEAMMKTWLPATLKGFEQLQEMFLAQMTAARQ